MSPHTLVRRWVVPALLSLTALLSACGGGSTAPSSTEAHSAETESSASISADEAAATPAFTALMEKHAQLNAQELKTAQRGMASNLRSVGTVRAQMADSVIPVYRFFNTKKAAHFYTASQAERDSITASLPTFQYEGIAFYASNAPTRGLSPVHRFYNSKTGVHMYSISEEERASIAANATSFADEGAAFYASKVSATGTAELRRFYVRNKGIHFYSASSTETENIRATMPNFVDEGPAFYTLNDEWTQPPEVDLTGSWTLTAHDSEGADWSGSVLVVEAQYPVNGANQLVGQLERYRNGVYQGYERIWGRFYPDGTLDLPTYAVSTKYGVNPKYKAKLNVAGDKMTEGTWLGSPAGTWTAVRTPE